MLNERAKKLVQALGKDFEAAIVYTQPNRFYFLDYDSHDAGALLIFPQEMVYVIDSRYIESAKSKITGCEIVLEKDATEQIYAILQERGVKKVLVEDSITVARNNACVKKFVGVEVQADDKLQKAVNGLRAIKDAEEISRMQRAQKITDDCFAHILPFIKVGVREIDIMLEMETFMRKNGAEKVAFDTICVAGKKSSLPHGVPGQNKVQQGDFVTMDFGANVEGYCTDMTRTVVCGQPSEQQKQVYDVVLAAHLAGIAAAKHGAVCTEVDKVARDIISAAGFGENFGHGLGHAVGIEIHEEPYVSPKGKGKLQEGMMVTIEPGVYLPAKFGCRIEDTVLITKDGCQPLAKSPKELISVG